MGEARGGDQRQLTQGRNLLVPLTVGPTQRRRKRKPLMEDFSIHRLNIPLSERQLICNYMKFTKAFYSLGKKTPTVTHHHGKCQHTFFPKLEI